MDKAAELYAAIRVRYPTSAERADKEHLRRYGELRPELAFVWLESLAATVNAGMSWKTPNPEHTSLFRDIASAFREGTEEIRRCIDVSFVENLFWEVPAEKVQAHWQSLPSVLQELYVAFHKRTPL